MSRDDEARAAGFLSAADMDAHALQLEEDHLAETHWLAGSPTPEEMWRRLEEMPDARELTIKEAAAALAVSPKTIYRRVGALADLDPPLARKIGTDWKIKPEGLEALSKRPERTQPPTRPRRSTRATSPQRPPTGRWEA